MLWLWISLAFVVVIVIVMVSYVEIQGVHVYRATHRHVRYDVRALFGLVRLSFNIPIFKFKGFDEGFELDAQVGAQGANDNISDMKQQITWTKLKEWYALSKLLMSHVDDFFEWLMASLARVKCTEFRWHTELGTGDAASAAMLSGVAWGMKSTVAGAICHTISLHTKPQMNVVVKFNETIFSTQLIVTFKVRHVELVRVPWTLFIRICKIKGGLNVWRKSMIRPLKSSMTK